jgi:hypothetical protein
MPAEVRRSPHGAQRNAGPNRDTRRRTRITLRFIRATGEAAAEELRHAG